MALIAAVILDGSKTQDQIWAEQVAAREREYAREQAVRVQNAPREVVYKLTGTAPSVSITYSNDTGGTSQRSGMALPWVMPLSGFAPGDHLYLSAQNSGDYGTVRAEILVDGSVFKSSESSGAFVIASASGLLE